MTGRHSLADTTLRERTAVAVADPVLRTNVAAGVDRFVAARRDGLAELHDPDALRRRARVVKAVNNIYAVALKRPIFDGRPATIWYCGDDRAAKLRVAELIRSLGFDAVDAGPLPAFGVDDLPFEQVAFKA